MTIRKNLTPLVMDVCCQGELGLLKGSYNLCSTQIHCYHCKSEYDPDAFKLHSRNYQPTNSLESIKLAYYKDLSLGNYLSDVTRPLRKRARYDRTIFNMYDEMEDIEFVSTIPAPKRPKKKSVVVSGKALKRTKNATKLKFQSQYIIPDGDYIRLTRTQIKFTDYRGQHPVNSDYDYLVVNRDKGSFTLIDNDTNEVIVIALFDRINEDDYTFFQNACTAVESRFHGASRGQTVLIKSVYTFGFTHAYSIVRTKDTPCVPHKKPGHKQLTRVQSVEKAAVNQVATRIWQNIKSYSKKIADSILATVGDKASRKLVLGNDGETGFTSMTFNLGGVSFYHRDVHDHPHAFSLTSILWKSEEEVGQDEGLIVLPEYRIAFQLRDKDCYLLKSRTVVHGVSPTKSKRNVIVGYQHQYV